MRLSMTQLQARFVLVSLAMASALLSGCGRHSTSEHYYLIATNINLEYWHTAEAGLQRAAAEYHVTAEMRGTGYFDPKGEVTEFRTVLAMKPAGILVSIADPDLMRPEINKAIAQGVPVITIDSDAPDSQRLYFIGTNNLAAGRLGGQRVAAQLNGKGTVVFFTNPGQPNLEERLKGYKDVLATFPGIKIGEVFDMQGDPGKALDKSEEYLTRTGANKVDALVCLEAAAGKDVAEAIKRHHAEDRTLVTMDVDPSTLELVKSGEIDATISQKPFTMAYLGLKGLDEIHHSPPKSMTVDYSLNPYSPFPAFVDTGVALVDKSNVDLFLKGLGGH
jgi:ribose transport system substrate-binding protein